MALKILVADDHHIVRQGLRGLIESAGDMTVVGEAPDGTAAVFLAQSLHPDLVLMDLEMPRLHGLDAIRALRAHHPATPVVVLSMHTNRQFVRDAFRVGARGYVLKDAAFEELAAAVRSVAAGKTYLSPKLSDAPDDAFPCPAPPKPLPATSILTGRERDVLRLVAEGRATKQIASDLNVSIKTIETHRRQIMDKLKLYSVAELTKYAIRVGLTSLG